MGDFRMPSLGADMEHGKMVEWLIKPGDYVHRGDVVAVVDTDKTVMDVESFEEGVVAELLVDVGTTVPIGTPLARITQTPDDGAGQAGGRPAGPLAKAASGTAEAAVTAGAVEPAGAAAAAAQVPPPVRHLAHQLGVETAGIRGTGRHGAVTRADVEHAAAARPRPAAPAVPAAAAVHAARVPHGARVRSSPRARRLADQLGVDIGSVPGTGPDGAVTEADIQRAVSGHRAAVPAEEAPAEEAALPGAEALPPKETPPSEAQDRLSSLRRAIGALMSRSKKSIPHYYVSTTLDLRAAIAWMQQVNEQRPVASRLVPSALLLKATALAAREVPEVNGFFTDGVFRPSSSVHLGVAVALRHGGLVAPAIHDADTLALDVLMQQLRDLVSRARAGRLQRAEMADPTLTVTNLGDLGVEAVYGVIYPPQVAMVGLGKLVEQPWAHDGMLGVRPAVTATLSADHRVSDGLRGGRFLARIDELLQKPEEL
ncbi:pyruvate dehydrogenase E2 component (dihydrolipoamide acetyltransferase) [Arthrobacter sp. PvP023]|uniref:2-oxo acid dehydrogenase subunit E2 n=1 Tax=Micrococcaceae TaxID=1268 RepID=UPI001B47C90F|nr:2-oxo acid dehydrogenase subunit E2 [Arthrobacter sp. PvP023]MBP1137815.1 pyruvate dehydrogenase E2 component (dihydrolipoamide acetyltransferase) [Arthrobacter sp. PvP023]